MTLQNAIEAYTRALPPGRTSAFAIESLDRLGLPVRIVPFQTEDGRQFDGFGYGTTPDEALVGALGEISESVHCELAMRSMPRLTGSYRELVKLNGANHVADPPTLSLPAGSPYHPDMVRTWVGATRMATGEPVWVPVEFAAISRGQLPGYEPLITPITNGLGAGLTRKQAIGHGLLELLQRDGNCTSFRALDQGIVVGCELGLDSETRALLDHLAAAGLKVRVKLAAREFGIVSVYAVGDEPHDPPFPMALTACGEAAHPHAITAIRKALLEFAAARCRKTFMHGPLELVARVAPAGYLERYLASADPAGEEPRCLEAMTTWLGHSSEKLRNLLAPTVFSEREVVPLTSLPTVEREAVADPDVRADLVAGRLTAAGCDVLVIDFSPPGEGVFVTKALVTRLECETMSYYRLGERGLLRLIDRGEDFVGIGRAPNGALPLRLTVEAEARVGGPAWLDTWRVDAQVGALYPLYREPNSHMAQLNLARRG